MVILVVNVFVVSCSLPILLDIVSKSILLSNYAFYIGSSTRSPCFSRLQGEIGDILLVEGKNVAAWLFSNADKKARLAVLPRRSAHRGALSRPPEGGETPVRLVECSVQKFTAQCMRTC